jgi:16S rRNA U1498 N3-methylase RsmE
MRVFVLRFFKTQTRWGKTNRTLWETDKTLKSVLKRKYHHIIGPEGDFSEKKSQWQLIVAIPVSLGTTRLRTETAA